MQGYQRVIKYGGGGEVYGKLIANILKKASVKELKSWMKSSVGADNKNLIKKFLQNIRGEFEDFSKDDYKALNALIRDKKGIKGSNEGTLSEYWSRVKDYINEHPKTSMTIPAVLLGTGPGRWALGKTLSVTQSNPSDWFKSSKDNIETKPEGIEYIDINGTQFQMQKGADGKYTLISNQSAPADSVDVLIQSANNTPQNQSQTDYNLINDLFEAYQ